MDQTFRFNKTRTVLVLTALMTALPLSTAGDVRGASYGGYYSGQSDIAIRAQARLQAKTDAAMATLEKGRALYKEGEYEKALEAFKAGINELPNSPLTADRRTYAESLVSTGTIAVAQQYRKTGRYEDATTLLQEILEKDPTNRAARQELAYVKDPVRSNPALTPKHVENVKEVNKGLQKAFGYYDLGEYDDADREFNAILRIDPYNTAARRGMEKVANARSSYYESARDQTRAAMLNEVNAAWEAPILREIPKVGGSDDSAIGGSMSPATVNLMKLKNIIIPVVNFENTTVEEAIDFLRQRSRQYDTGSGEKGINFIIRTTSSSGGAAAPAEDEFNLENMADLGVPDTVTQPSGAVVIPELKLRNVPMLEVLKFITDNAGMRYKIEDYAVSILPSGKDDTDMFSRTFTVPPNFYSSLQSSSGDAGGDIIDDPFNTSTAPASGIKAREPVDVLLKRIGVAFPAGATATFMASSSSLIARNTPSNLDIIEQYIENLKSTSPKQVKIMTKFVEVSQDNTEELSFDWVVSPIKVGGADRYIGGGSMGSGTPDRFPGDFVGAPAGTNQWVDGIAGTPTSEVKNIVTSGNRTGSGAISGDSINSVINNPNRSSSRDAPAPGIMSFTGIFDQGSMQMIMRGLSQKKGTDVMTAPSVTAKSAEKAKIEVVREFIYPTDYTEPQLPSSTGNNDNNNGWGAGIAGGGSQASINAFPVTPSTPTGFTTRPVGVTLEIEPNITDGEFVIDFRFVPEIVEFDGFINYGSPISTAGIDADGNPATVVITENRIEMPVFSTRRVETNLYVYDGHTVSIGGLMQESVQTVEDSVPILGDLPLVGRLFRSEANSHIKTNLIIFVTADIIDATGRPVRNRETEMGVTTPTESGAVSEEGLLPPM